MFRSTIIVLAIGASTAFAAPASMTITSDRVIPMQQVQSIPGSGNVEAAKEIKLYSETAGVRILAMKVAAGDFVTEGQVIAVLDDDALKNVRKRADAALVAASSQLEAAKSALERAERLAAAGAGTRESLESLKASYDNAKSTRLQAQSTYEDAVRQETKAELKAPISGLVLSVDQLEGTLVQSGASVITVARDGHMKVVAKVPEKWAFMLVKDMPTTVVFADGHTEQGKTEAPTPVVDAATHLAKIDIDLPDDTTSHPGMFAMVGISAKEKTVLTVPAKSVVWRVDGAKVFKIVGNGKVAETPVTTGNEQGGRIPIEGNISEGDIVAVEGAGFLSDKDVVAVAGAAK